MGSVVNTPEPALRRENASRHAVYATSGQGGILALNAYYTAF